MTDEFTHRLINLMRHPSIKDQPIGTIGELADRLEQAYRERHYRPAPARTGALNQEHDRVFQRTRRT